MIMMMTMTTSNKRMKQQQQNPKRNGQLNERVFVGVSI